MDTNNTAAEHTARMARDLDDTSVAGALRSFFAAHRFDFGIQDVSAECGLPANRIAGSMNRMWKSGDLKTMRTGVVLFDLFFAR